MSFKDIKGQDKPIAILKGYIKYSHLAGSYLFSGEEGIGKRLVAKTLAKALNCSQQAQDACDACPSCLKIERAQHSDVYSISAEGSDSIKIESIRQLQRDINLKSYEGGKKIFIIDDAHNLTADAENALLKKLEEPPPESLIILISARTALLFKTIVSRCKIIKFYPLKKMQLEEALKKDYLLNNDLAHFLAYFCEGRLGYALRLKEKDILREKNKIIEEFVFSGEPRFGKISVENKDNMRGYLNILAACFRDMYLAKTGAPAGELINLDCRDALFEAANRYSWMDLDRIMRFLSNSLLCLEQNINIKLLLSNLRENFTYGA